MAALALAVVGCAYGQTVDPNLAFDVASVKESPPPDGGKPIYMVLTGIPGRPGPKDPGRFVAENLSLPNLIAEAYDIPNSGRRLSAPGVSPISPTFNIEARMPVNTTKEQFLTMMQNLLKERFGLKVHWESQQITAYDLVVAKGGLKIKEAEPDPPGAPPPAPPGRVQLGPNGYPQLPPGKFSITSFLNGKAAMRGHLQTMEEIARNLSGQMGGPGKNATGLTGKYDYTLYWSVSAGRALSATQPGTDGMPIDEDTGPSLMMAIQEQLGLKLESKKEPMQVLVVDHVETKPTAN
jgi:uncharacterized protein (TIGR03435 family)